MTLLLPKYEAVRSVNLWTDFPTRNAILANVGYVQCAVLEKESACIRRRGEQINLPEPSLIKGPTLARLEQQIDP